MGSNPTGGSKKFNPNNPSFVDSIKDYIINRCTGEPTTDATSIISVQPMNQPAASIFYVDIVKPKSN